MWMMPTGAAVLDDEERGDAGRIGELERGAGQEIRLTVFGATVMISPVRLPSSPSPM